MQTKARSSKSSNAAESVSLLTSEATTGSKNDKFVNNNNNVLEKEKKTERAWVISVLVAPRVLQSLSDLDNPKLIETYTQDR